MLPYIANAGSPQAQFVAGLLYEFVGDNQLEEIERCYQGSLQVIDDIEEEIQLLDNHNFVKAAKLMAQIKEELKNGVQTCAAGVKKDVEEVL